MANGVAANLALFSTLPQRGDLIVADELIHASVHDGIRMSKAAAVFARHNDVQSFADLIVAWRPEIGRASWRERGCPYLLISVVAVALKKTKKNSQQHKYT